MRLTPYRCSNCFDDSRGVPVRDRQAERLGATSWVACAWCGPVTVEKAKRFVEAHARQVETDAIMRNDAVKRFKKGLTE